MRALPAILAMAALVAVAVFVADRPGSVAIAWQGWRVDTSVAVLVLGTVVIAVLAAALYNLLRRIWRAPRAFLRARRERRRQAGYRALTQGMVAVAAGDAAEAQRLARKADVLLAEPPLTLLLSAQAAQLSGDEQAAQRYFTTMLKRPETEFLGIRGLILQALRAGNEQEALRLTHRAKALRPRTPWVLRSLFELEARAGKWNAAEAALIEATRRKTVPAEDAKRHRAVLLHEAARAAEAEGRPNDAIRLAAKAQGLAPGFAPTAILYAHMLELRGQERPARKALEAAWRAEPHPDLAREYNALFAGEAPLLRLKRMERLAAAHPDHIESHLALARAALDARLWGEARRHLAAIEAQESARTPAPRLCRLMAELEDAEHDNPVAAQEWLRRAAASEARDPVYVCRSCAAESAQWSALCPRCRSLDSLEWRAPLRAAPAPAAIPAAASLPAPVTVLAPAPGSGAA
ncbi:MAG TPA: heme biosynthesis HemY N-terminal domain-containing protein [Stellaceae bacterium]|nr:heme biosynthesis HemY N-terminal domain-containing protein [Stellaceae bacterium]